MTRCLGLLVASIACMPLGCTEPTVISDLNAKAVVYGHVVTDGSVPPSGTWIFARVYQSGECGVSAPSGAYGATTDNTGAYRILLQVLASKPFLGCVTVSEDSTVVAAPRRVLLRFDSPTIDSARVDVVRVP